MRKNTLKETLSSGKPAFGTFVTMDAPDLVEVIGIAGFDFVVIDTEHGPGNPWSIQHMIRAADVRNISTVVRVPNHERTSILKVLDIGAQGVQVPMTNDMASFRDMSSGAHYAPLGIRGAALTRSADYGMGLSAAEYFARANDEILTVAHCETVECFKNLSSLVAVPGVDVIFLGPFDMSQSLGIPGQVDDARVQDVIERAIEIVLRGGKIGGIFTSSPEDTRAFLDMGYRYIAYGLDVGIMASAYSALAATLRRI
jgi:4-hydroxy-2-oxoheptanedioate aldolase